MAIGLLGYFFFIRPQQRKAQAAKAVAGLGLRRRRRGPDRRRRDRHRLWRCTATATRFLTGALGDDGNLDGPQPTRIVFVRQAIAKKIDPMGGVRVDDEPVQDVRPARSSEQHERQGQQDERRQWRQP